MTHSLSIAAAVLSASLPAFSQPGPLRAFEAASIKPASPADTRGPTFEFPAGGLKITNGTLKAIIETAYEVREFQIAGAPSWANSERYSITANSASDDPVMRSADSRQRMQETRRRLQILLAQRFQLVVHREARELPVYALVVGKGGPKLTEARNVASGSPPGIRTGCGQMTGTSTSMANLAVMLSRQFDRAVLDRTALTGKYDFQFEWTPDSGSCGGAASGTLDGPSIFTAVQENLGLKLESTKGSVEIVVIDHAERPDAN